MSHTTAERTRSRKGVFRKAAASTAALAAAATVGVSLLSVPAAAVGVGPGIQGTYGFMGALVDNNYGNVYCLDSSMDVPFGIDGWGGPVSYLPAMGAAGAKDANADELGRMNYILSNWGWTSDPATAAAAHVAVTAYVKSGGLDTALSYINDPAVAALATDMYWASQSATIGGSPVSGYGELVFEVDGSNNYNGTVTMVGSPGASGTVTLTNGVFVLDGVEYETVTGVQEGVAYQVRGVPPTDDGAPYSISGTGTFTVGSGDVWPAALGVLNYGDSYQRTGYGLGSEPGTSTFSVSGHDPMERSVTFQPILATSANTFVEAGTAPVDNVTFSTVADANGVNNDWFQRHDGAFAPITANGTLYGPFAAQPEESDTVPTDAPVAGHATVTTPMDSDPRGQSIAVSSDTVVDESGFYTWVWDIDANVQTESVRGLIPEGYYFQDRFGQTVESHIVPSKISATTNILNPEGIALSSITEDILDVDVNGIWVQDGGKQIPVVFRGDAYYVPLEFAEDGLEQVPGTEIPEYARHLGSITTTVDETGTHQPEEGIKAPAAGEGYVTWVWSIRAEDQPEQYRGWVENWTDDFGVPAETTMLLQPEVHTKATPGVRPGEDIQDTAFVDGVLPDGGAELTFDLYEVPMIEDPENPGTYIIDYPEGVEPGDLTWVCTDENVVYDGSTQPGEIVTEPGEYLSEPFQTDEFHRYLWVEELWSVPGDEEERELIHRGHCGEPEESSVVVDITTKAVTDGSNITAVDAGQKVWDTVNVVGYIPEGSSIEVEVYLNDKGTAPVCDTPVATLAVTSDMEERLYTPDAPLELKTVDGFVNDGAANKDLYFVEVTKDGLDREISRGECGDPNETAGLKERGGKGLFATGGELPVLPFALGGVALAGLLAGGAVYGLRKNKAE